MAKPDYNVHALIKGTQTRNKIGAAWKKPDGRISLVLNPFIKLEHTDDLLITLFPYSEKQDAAPATKDHDDEIPF